MRGTRGLNFGSGIEFTETAEDAEDNAIAAFTHKGEGALCFCADAGEEAVAHQGACAMQADFHVFLGEFECCGGFGSRELFDIAQHDDSTVLLGKIEDGLFKEPCELGDRGALLRVGGAFRNPGFGVTHGVFSVVIEVLELHAAPAYLKTMQRFVDGNAGEPDGKWGMAGELVEMLIRAHVGVLDDILSLGPIAQNGARDAV